MRQDDHGARGGRWSVQIEQTTSSVGSTEVRIVERPIWVTVGVSGSSSATLAVVAGIVAVVAVVAVETIPTADPIPLKIDASIFSTMVSPLLRLPTPLPTPPTPPNIELIFA